MMSIPKLGWAPIIYLRANDDRVSLRHSHFRQGETEFLREQCASDFNETQISDVGYHAPTISIEKHHLHFCADKRPASIHCPEITTKMTEDTKLN